VNECGVDYLAVAIGNAHGKYIAPPQIDIERVKQLRDKLSIPMVMHGGSGIPDDQLAPCVRMGVVKYNFGTNFWLSFFEAEKALLQGECRPSGLWIQQQIAPSVKDFVRGRIRALNPDNKKIF
jgi:fructose/tagatose bisphosphate aldolase